MRIGVQCLKETSDLRFPPVCEPVKSRRTHHRVTLPWVLVLTLVAKSTPYIMRHVILSTFVLLDHRYHLLFLLALILSFPAIDRIQTLLSSY